jgi:transposase
VASHPDLTLDELRAWLAAEHDVGASLGLMHATLARLGLTRKKDRPGSGAGPAGCRPRSHPLACPAGRALWAAADLHRRDRGGYQDGAPIRPQPTRRAPGLRCPARPLEKTTTFLAGLTGSGFLAPCVTDGAMTGELFRVWTEQMLGPELRPGDLVIMDNLAAHKVKGVREAIEASGAELRHLPPYSPDLNPIEQAWAKLKTLLRKAAERTIEGLWNAIGRLLASFSPAECANYIANSGYPRSG